MFRHTFTVTATAVLALAVGLLAAGCSSDPSSPGVASLGPPTTTASSAANGDSQATFAKALQFSQCMRSHGLKNFPDPGLNSGGGGVTLQLGKSSGIDPNSSAFQAAQKACQSLLPAGGPKGGAAPFDPTKISAWTACMRQHGLPNLPDPTNTGDGLKLDLTGTNISPNKMQPAMQACRSKYPGGGLQMSTKGGSGGAVSGGGSGG
jgi:hypothetical protein